MAGRYRYSERTVKIQRGSNLFHWTMVLVTGGAWFFIWPFFRHTVRVKTSTRSW